MYVDIFAAIVGLLKASGPCTSLMPGGVHAGRAPQGSLAAGPFAVVTEVGASLIAMTAETTPTRTDDGSIQVAIYATSRDAAILAGNAVKQALTDAAPTLATGVVIYIRQSSRYASIDPDPGPGGSIVWQEIREFRVIVSQEL